MTGGYKKKFRLVTSRDLGYDAFLVWAEAIFWFSMKEPLFEGLLARGLRFKGSWFKA